MSEEKTITVGKLKEALSIYSDDTELSFNGLEFSRIKSRGEKLAVCEFTQMVYLDEQGVVVVQTLE